MMRRFPRGIIVAALLIVACSQPSPEEAACRDYVAAVDEGNEVKANAAIERLADREAPVDTPGNLAQVILASQASGAVLEEAEARFRAMLYNMCSEL